LTPKLSPHLEKLGLEIVDLAVLSAGQRLTLKITIDKKVISQEPGEPLGPEGLEKPGDPEGPGDLGGPGGLGGLVAQAGSRVTIDHCAAFSRIVSNLLDELDPEPGPEYSLEVSSPGLDRALKNLADFERFSGSLVKIKLKLGDKTTRFTATMFSSPLRLVTDQGEIAFTLEEVISCKLVPMI
jgi:ribosome maturation factor RimP